MNIVAVVVTYNRKDLLVECLNAILQQTYQINKVVIIDNNSTDGTYEKLKEAKILDNKEIIVYKKLEKNIGGAGGFHEGMKLSKQYNPDFVWIMDDDTIPNKDCLENLLKANNLMKEKNEKVSFFASTIYGEKGEFMNVPVIDERPSENGYPDWYKYLNKGIVEIKIATFVLLLINIDAIKTCGLPCKDFFIWGDDTEYTTRITKYYGNAYMVGDSIAIHKRKNARAISIFDEDNPNRMRMHFYKTRNLLIYTNEYQGKMRLIKTIFSDYKDIFKLLFKPGVKYRLKKAGAIFKGVNSFAFKRYDSKTFKNRMNA